MSEDDVRGRFVWHELMTTEPDAATGFYRDVVGWSPQPWQGETPYTLLMNGERPTAGAMALPDELRAAGVPPHWMVYVGVPDVDATVRRATGLGAAVLAEPQDIPGVGRFAVLRDPQGAAFAVFHPAGDGQGPPDEPGEREFSWHELATTDHRAALRFYGDLFGWEGTEAHDMGEMGIYQIFGVGGRMLGGMFDKPAEMPGPPAWLPYARVADVHRVAEETKARGGTVLNGPMEVPGGDWIVQAMDPQGAVFAVHQVGGGAG